MGAGESTPTLRRRSDSEAVATATASPGGFLAAGLLLLVPFIYLVILVATVQLAALATEGAARQAARVFA